jgi:hypothetical protein
MIAHHSPDLRSSRPTVAQRKPSNWQNLHQSADNVGRITPDESVGTRASDDLLDGDFTINIRLHTSPEPRRMCRVQSFREVDRRAAVDVPSRYPVTNGRPEGPPSVQRSLVMDRNRPALPGLKPSIVPSRCSRDGEIRTLGLLLPKPTNGDTGACWPVLEYVQI